MVDRFNIRVYGLLIDKAEVLLITEEVSGFRFTKFPGGGLEFGEGTHECLIREFKEETGLDVRIKSHFYTTDFFQQSAFKKGDQLFSIYYIVETDMDRSQIVQEESDEGKAIISLDWVPLKDLKEEMVTFPIDKKVVLLLGQ
jgi:8-oxo-dGTP diphosphatase